MSALHTFIALAWLTPDSLCMLLADAEGGKDKKEVKERFAFKTKSEVEILDDGFKWRKYGKKMVKNSPNPRYFLL